MEFCPHGRVIDSQCTRCGYEGHLRCCAFNDKSTSPPLIVCAGCQEIARAEEEERQTEAERLEQTERELRRAHREAIEQHRLNRGPAYFAYAAEWFDAMRQHGWPGVTVIKQSWWRAEIVGWQLWPSRHWTPNSPPHFHHALVPPLRWLRRQSTWDAQSGAADFGYTAGLTDTWLTTAGELCEDIQEH